MYSKSLTFPSFFSTFSHSTITSMFCFCETGFSKLHIDDSMCLHIFDTLSVSCPLFLLTGHCFPIQQCFSLSQNLVGFSWQLSVIPIAWMFRQAMLPVFFWEKLYDIRYSKERSIQIPLPLRKHSGFSTSGSIFSEEKVHYK